MNSGSHFCYELKIYVSEKDKDAIADLLLQWGFDNFVMGAFSCDIPAEYDAASAGEDLYEKNIQESPMSLFHEDLDFLKNLQASLEKKLPTLGVSEFQIAIGSVDPNWKESWKDSFQPISVGQQLVVLPPWIDRTVFSEKIKMVINPGMAFGTGQHETTKLCLEMMLQEKNFSSFLDVGTGSGILAIAARFLGCQKVVGNDIDESCLPIAVENERENFGNCQIQFLTQPVSVIELQDFDLIIANIQAGPLKSILKEIILKKSNDGTVICSGILNEEKSDFIRYAEQCGLVFKSQKTQNDWCALKFQ